MNSLDTSMAMEENSCTGLPPGFRFHPTDEELITYYLTPKVNDFDFTSKAIADVDLNKCEPWDLPGRASMGEKEWYFFSLRDRKYPTGLRTNRATEAGYWKTTGKDKEILRQPGGTLVGMKKTLVFYKGRAPKGQKTNWVMHEYRIETKHPFRPPKEEWVVCRVFQKTAIMKKPQLASSPQASLDDSPDENTNTYTDTNEFGDINLNSFSSPSCSSFIANPSFQGQGYHDHISSYDNNNNNDDININNLSPNLNSNINWLGGGGASSMSSWPSNLLSPTLNNTVNSLLLKALQLRTYHAREAASPDIFSLLPQLAPPPFGSTSQHLLPNTTTTPSSSPSPGGVVNNTNNITSLASTLSQQQQQQQHNVSQDQTFNMDSLW